MFSVTTAMDSLQFIQFPVTEEANEIKNPILSEHLKPNEPYFTHQTIVCSRLGTPSPCLAFSFLMPGHPLSLITVKGGYGEDQLTHKVDPGS